MPQDLTMRAFAITRKPMDAVLPEGRGKVIPVAFEDSLGTQVVNVPVDTVNEPPRSVNGEGPEP